MPIDHKRINGPDESVPYELFARLAAKDKPRDALKGQELEVDACDGQRKIYLQTGVITQAKGSAYIEIGDTKVIVSVFDPREIPNRIDYGLKGEVYCEFKYAPFSCKKRMMHQQNNEEKQSSDIMRKALESTVCLHELPNFQVDVYAMVLEEDGSALSAAIIAGGVALTLAGVPMYDQITSVTLGVRNGALIEPPFDDSGKEPPSCDNGLVVLSKLHSQTQICQFYQRGFMSKENVKKCIEVLSKQCDNIVPIVQKCLVKRIVHDIKGDQ
ncbi:hypothetical protein HUJ04_013086 [Dendroctonus ponderosae]